MRKAKFPDPPVAEGAGADVLQKRLLASDLVACGLLKADDGWEEQHLRTGTPPNPGWFASKPKADDSPKTNARPVTSLGSVTNY